MRWSFVLLKPQKQILDCHLADARGVGRAALPRPWDDHVQHLQQQTFSPQHCEADASTSADVRSCVASYGHPPICLYRQHAAPGKWCDRRTERSVRPTTAWANFIWLYCNYQLMPEEHHAVLLAQPKLADFTWPYFPHSSRMSSTISVYSSSLVSSSLVTASSRLQGHSARV